MLQHLRGQVSEQRLSLVRREVEFRRFLAVTNHGHDGTVGRFEQVRLVACILNASQRVMKEINVSFGRRVKLNTNESPIGRKSR